MRAESLLYSFKSHFAASRRAKPNEDESAASSVASDKNISAMVRVEQEALSCRTLGERVADTVTAVAVRPWFIGLHVVIYALWALANTIGPWRYDPWPFNFLSTIIAIEAIFLMLLVLASQQRMIRLSDRRAHLNLQVDLLAEQEMTAMIRMLERLFEQL